MEYQAGEGHEDKLFCLRETLLLTHQHSVPLWQSNSHSELHLHSDGCLKIQKMMSVLLIPVTVKSIDIHQNKRKSIHTYRKVQGRTEKKIWVPYLFHCHVLKFEHVFLSLGNYSRYFIHLNSNYRRNYNFPSKKICSTYFTFCHWQSYLELGENSSEAH